MHLLRYVLYQRRQISKDTPGGQTRSGILCAADWPGSSVRATAARSSSALGAGENFFASDVTALVSHTKNVIYLEDGELAEVRANSYTVFDCTGKPIESLLSASRGTLRRPKAGGY